MDGKGSEKRAKKVVLIVRHAPHGSVFAAEAMRAGIAFSGMGLDASILFVEDGVFCLMGGRPEILGMSGLDESFRNAEEFRLALFACKESMIERGLGKSTYEAVRLLGWEEMRKKVREADCVMCF